MMPLRAYGLLMVAAIWLIPAAANAQFDHLTCFKAKDSGKFKALVTLDAVQNAFDPPAQCKVIGKAKLFCVPTDKTVDELTVGKDPATPLDVAGPVLSADTICYKVKCPTATIADDEVVDQFGARTLSKFKAQMICAPAHKTSPTCQLPDPPQCTLNDPCSAGICSSTRGACTLQADCPLAPNEECCCTGVCI
jgi:hypothetical protein